MKLLAIVHEDDAGPGVFADAAHEHDWELVEWRIAESERLPGELESFDAVLSLGGAMHAHHTEAHPWLVDEEALLARCAQSGQAVLGICLGAQLLARATDGASGTLAEPEIGWYDVTLTPEGREDPLLGPLRDGFSALQWHSCDFRPGPHGVILAESERCLQACRVGPRAWSIQFHAEVTGRDFEGWLDHHLAHPGDGDAPDDPQRLRAVTRARIAAWNALGRELFSRFLTLAGDQSMVKTILP